MNRSNKDRISHLIFVDPKYAFDLINRKILDYRLIKNLFLDPLVFEHYNFTSNHFSISRCKIFRSVNSHLYDLKEV